MTGNLPYRIKQHKAKATPGFTQRYNVTRLVYFEEYESAYDAITREKQLKAGSCSKKMQLVDGASIRSGATCTSRSREKKRARSCCLEQM
jgi:putative endonuclease